MADTAEPPGPPGPELTRAQLAILEAIRKLAQDHGGRPPSMREVNRELGRSSPGGLSYQYSVLEGLGYLRRDPGCVRTVQVRLPGEPWTWRTSRCTRRGSISAGGGSGCGSSA